MKQEIIHVTVDNSPNIPAEVTRFMSEVGIPNPDFWRRYCDPAVDQEGITWQEQQHLLNDALRDYFIDLGNENDLDTRTPRCCLILTQDKGEWLRLIEKGVAPWLKKNVLSLIPS